MEYSQEKSDQLTRTEVVHQYINNFESDRGEEMLKTPVTADWEVEGDDDTRELLYKDKLEHTEVDEGRTSQTKVTKQSHSVIIIQGESENEAEKGLANQTEVLKHRPSKASLEAKRHKSSKSIVEAKKKSDGQMY